MAGAKKKSARRGRPPGRSSRGEKVRDLLFATATRLIAERGYERTTLRTIAAEAGVSVGNVYHYFPSKQAVVLHLYDTLSGQYAERAEEMPQGSWVSRTLFAIEASLDVLGPEREVLAGLTSVLIGDPEGGLFAPATTDARLRVQNAFVQAVVEADDAPDVDAASALGRLLYLAHLAVILLWLLDRSPRQRATAALLELARTHGQIAGLLLGLEPARGAVLAVERQVSEALFGDSA